MNVSEETHTGFKKRAARILSRHGRNRLRGYQSGDEKEILSLFRRVFGRSLNEEYWRWKYFENPFGEALTIVLSKSGTQSIVGHLAAIPMRLKVEREHLTAYNVVDLMIEGPFRRAGTFVQLTYSVSDAAAVNGGFLFGLPNEQSYKSFIKLGYAKIKTLDIFVRFLKWDESLEKFGAKKIAVQGIRWLGNFTSFFCRASASKRGEKIVIKEVVNFDSDAERLWKKASAFFQIAVVRDSPYLNWRYFKNPLRSYKVFSASEEEEWKGYMVLAVDDTWGFQVGFVVDLIVDPETPEAGFELLHYAERFLKTQGVVAIAGLFSFLPSYKKLFQRSGYWILPENRVKRPYHLITDLSKTFGHALADQYAATIQDGAKWFMTLGDTDLI